MPERTILAISLQDAAVFGPECVGELARMSIRLRSPPVQNRTEGRASEIRLAPRPKPGCRLVPEPGAGGPSR